MKIWATFVVLIGVLFGGTHRSMAFELSYSAFQVDENNVLLVRGVFAPEDNFEEFVAAVIREKPVLVTFDSPGGNPHAAMKLGRIIRSLRLGTFQVRAYRCESACALAFMGGAYRYAEAGSIGVHKSSFGAGSEVDREQAVSAVQATTAVMVSYMAEMGIDAELLEIALSYDSDDMRYLSISEMERYRVINLDDGPALAVAKSRPNERSGAQQGRQGAQTVTAPVDLTIPRAGGGAVRHPSGGIELRERPDERATKLAYLPNGIPLQIIGQNGRWHRVLAQGLEGYAHHTWVMVDEFARSSFETKHIQIKSFSEFANAQSYVRSSPHELSIYLASNGWFAITLGTTQPTDTVTASLKSLKTRNAIPEDSFATYGNTYVRKVCCHTQPDR